MNLPPAYQFPTTTMFLDDNNDFLDALGKWLKPTNSIIKTFDDPKKALAHLQNHITIKNWDTAWTKVCPSDNDFDSTAIEINFPKIHSVLHDQNRFNQVTTVVVDFQMPELDGLSFLGLLKDMPVKKILLTGIDDAEIAIKALDRGLIDNYLRKHDLQLPRKIAEIIEKNQFKYFEKQSNLINSALKIKQCYNTGLNISYCNIFDSVKTKHKTTEYYLTDENGSCMFINEKSERINLIIKSLEQLSAEQADQKLVPDRFKALNLDSEFYYRVEPSALFL